MQRVSLLGWRWNATPAVCPLPHPWHPKQSPPQVKTECQAAKRPRDRIPWLTYRDGSENKHDPDTGADHQVTRQSRGFTLPVIKQPQPPKYQRHQQVPGPILAAAARPSRVVMAVKRTASPGRAFPEGSGRLRCIDPVGLEIEIIVCDHGGTGDEKNHRNLAKAFPSGGNRPAEMTAPSAMCIFRLPAATQIGTTGESL